MSNDVPPIVDIEQLAKLIHQNATKKGFWKDSDLHNLNVLGFKLSLIHSEISEALEEARTGKYETYYNPDNPGKPEGLMIEIADCVIRCLDLAHTLVEQGLLETTLSEAIDLKMGYNKERPFMHGKRG